MKLTEVKNGICKIQKINGNAKLKLLRMGISEGDNIEVLYKIKNGPVIIKVFSTEIAIGKGMAEEIEVEETNSKVVADRKFAINSFSNFKENFNTAKRNFNGILIRKWKLGLS